MKIAIYGGSFNPPHLGHLEAARAAQKVLKPDKLIIIPDNVPPHKLMAEGSPTAEQRFEMCRALFSELPNCEVSDIELRREGRSYTCETVRELRRRCPNDKLHLIIGTDMLLSFEEWREFEYLLSECTLAALTRDNGEDDALTVKAAALHAKYAARVVLVPHKPLPMSSSEIREALRERKAADRLSDRVYSYIIKNRLYNAKPDFDWLRKKAYAMLDDYRVKHVAGCELEAVRLAAHYGLSTEDAATAAILHDITKKQKFKEQLILFEKYAIICPDAVKEKTQLMHAYSGAEIAKVDFGVSDEVYSAIRYHTTGRPDMTELEKLMYLADYIEPTRDFDGVDKLRKVCYESLDAGMALGLKMSIEELRGRGIEPYIGSIKAFDWYKKHLND